MSGITRVMMGLIIAIALAGCARSDAEEAAEIAADSPILPRGEDLKEAEKAASAGDAQAIAAKLDLTSFRNSTAGRRRAGARTPADYGFSRVEAYPGGVNLYRPVEDGDDVLRVAVVRADAEATLLCLTDRTADGSHSVSGPTEVKRGGDGLWRATGRPVTHGECPFVCDGRVQRPDATSCG